jgi:hypothetical protein
MTAAMFGLLGVIVGGVINGAVARWQSRCADSNAVRAAARLLLDELTQGWALVDIEEGGEVVKSERVPTTHRWTEYEELFARALPINDWIALREVIERLRKMGSYQTLPDTTGSDKPPPVYAATTRARLIVVKLATWGSRPPLRHRLVRRRS